MTMNSLKNNVILFLTVTALWTSCTVGKKYARTDLAIPENYRQPATSVTADSVALPWKTFFRDPVLVNLIQNALDRNNDISIAMMNMEQLGLSYKQAKMGLLPTANLSIGANRSFLSKNSLNGSLSEQFIGTSYLDDYNASISVSWEADIWGKAKMQKEATRANYFAQKENLAALKTRIIVQVAQAYYNLISLDEQLIIARRNIDLSDSTLFIMQLQFKSGQVNSMAVDQAEAQKKTAELLIPLAMQNIAVQENALSILCGTYPDSISRSGNLNDAMPEQVFPAGVPAQLLSRRPDVKSAELTVISANARTGLAKAAMYPTISITPQIGSNSFKASSWFDLPGSLTKTIGANLTQPIFQKRALKTAHEIAQLDQEIANAQFKQTVLTAVGEVSDAMARSGFASERLALIVERSSSLDKSRKDALMLYKSGMATYLEVITAVNNSLQNDLEKIGIKREKLNALTDMYRALGGGIM